jgi:hypothetical protein
MQQRPAGTAYPVTASATLFIFQIAIPRSWRAFRVFGTVYVIITSQPGAISAGETSIVKSSPGSVVQSQRMAFSHWTAFWTASPKMREAFMPANNSDRMSSIDW